MIEPSKFNQTKSRAPRLAQGKKLIEKNKEIMDKKLEKFINKILEKEEIKKYIGKNDSYCGDRFALLKKV